jgi:uncharacterized protein
VRIHLGVLVLLVVVLASCGGGDESEEAATPTAPAEDKTQVDETVATPPDFGDGHVVIETGESEPVNVLVEVAETPEQQAYGLMFRKALPPDRGMAFVFPSDTDTGFWMKNTLIPLSIAYYDARGKIVKILDMEPCTADPCPKYDPGAAYRGALEVNQGAFADWGVEEGDTIVLHPL